MPDPSPGVADKMTIDELARASGTTTRTVRSYQDRGLIAPPEIVGRTGYYDAEHLERLQIIAKLLEQRFSLAAIGALFRAWEGGQSLAEILGVVEELSAPEREPSQVVSVAEMEESFPQGQADWLDRAIGLGIFGEVNDAEVEVISPRLLEAGAKLVAAGVPVERMLDEGEQLAKDCDRIATRFVELFMSHIWEPFSAAGRPPAELEKVVEYLAITRPLPIEATSVMLAQAMQRQLERALAGIVADEENARPPSDPVDATTR
jgi:DNA-binding transcriptional MerR regulator